MTGDDWPDWPPAARPVHTLHLPEEIHMPEPGLRQRVTEAIAESWKANVGDRFDDLDQECVNRDADAVLPIVRAEVEAAVAEVLEIEAANCAREIDRAVAAEAEVERLRAEVEQARNGNKLLTRTLERQNKRVRELRAEADAELAEHGPGQCVRVEQHDAVQADWEDQLAAVRRARQLADRWDAEGAWTVLGSDGTESAAAELRAALDGPTTEEHHVVDGTQYLCHTDDHYCPTTEERR